MTYRRLLILLLAGLMVGLTACRGVAASTKPVEVRITLSEFKIESPQATFSKGVPYRFVIKNAGKLAHEWAITPRGAKDSTKALIHVKDSELPAGATVSQEFTFTQSGNFEFACHLPGHYEAGMVLPIVVS